MEHSVEDFIKRHSLGESAVNPQRIVQYILGEMTGGLAGSKSSMPMIDSRINCGFEITGKQSVIVIDAGGTNLRSCLVTLDSEMNPEISDFKKTAMPGSVSEVSVEQFFGTFADMVEPLIDRSNRIGFCFSYPASTVEEKFGIDGRLMFFSKEIRASEVVGKQIGKELLSELQRRGHDVAEKKLCLLNDTVATLLAGLSENKKTNTEGCVGIILGTGTNQAYIEADGNIINEESGCLDISLGDIDSGFCETTKQPDKYHFEKMISGAYLGPKALFAIQKAKEEGVLSSGFTVPSVFDTVKLSDFLNGDTSMFDKVNEHDSKALTEILTAFVKRAAKLTACGLAASVLKSRYGVTKPVLINVDGTTYYKTKHLKEYTEHYLKEILDRYGKNAVFTGVENSPLIGSAIGALTL